MSGYNTNLAAEFYVLSMLHRFGVNANLTLGNKKSVDIAVVRDAGDTITVDVKGLAGKTGWPVDNIKQSSDKHFIALVCFLGQIEDSEVAPEVYVVPSSELETLFYNAPGGRKLINYKTMQTSGAKYKNAYQQLR